LIEWLRGALDQSSPQLATVATMLLVSVFCLNEYGFDDVPSADLQRSLQLAERTAAARQRVLQRSEAAGKRRQRFDDRRGKLRKRK